MARARQRVSAMVRALVHRGPDGQWLWQDSAAPIVLGHNRLAILDRSNAGAQPMLSSSGRFVVNFNGEIYNFRRLRSELDQGACGPRMWRSHGDTEVLVEAIEAFGVEEAIAKVEGMFAIGVWDRAERRLSLIRDRVGEKPLYYGTIDGDFAFASELKAIRSAFGERLLEINASVLSEYLRAGHIPAPHTIYRRVLKVPAGHIVSIDVASGSGSILVSKPRCFWAIRSVTELRGPSGPRTS